MTDANAFLLEVASFDASPAGQALIETDPAMVLRLIMDRAKAIESTRFNRALKTGTSY
jgi:hypothetical protein